MPGNSRQRTPVSRRNTRRLAAALPKVPQSGPVESARIEPATVTAVTAGAGADGNALVTISWAGGTFQVPWLDTAPTNGATVTLLVQGAQKIILGTPKGRP